MHFKVFQNTNHNQSTLPRASHPHQIHQILNHAHTIHSSTTFLCVFSIFQQKSDEFLRNDNALWFMLSRRSQHIVELLGMCAPTGTFPFPFLEAEHFLSAIRISFSVVEHCSSPQFDRTAAWRSKEHAEFQLVVCVHVVSGTTRVQPRVRAFGNFWRPGGPGVWWVVIQH